MVDQNIFKTYLDKDISYVGGKSAAEIKTKAEKLYKLSSNENPIGPSPMALQAISKAYQNVHIYPDRTDIRLREALAIYYRDSKFISDHFMCGNAGSDVLDMICRAFLTESSECIISTPCFSPYKMFSTWYGSKIIDIPLNSDNYDLDINGIVHAINDNTRLIFLTSPNNPTGTYIPKDQLIQLLDQLPSHVVVVYDEVYFHFADAEDFTTAVSLVQQGYNVIALNSFSKTYGLAAMRLGYAYGPLQIMKYLRNLAKPFIINQLSIEAGIAALQDTEFVKKTVDTVREEKVYLYKELEALGIKYWPTQANFILIDPPIPDSELEAKLLEEGVMVRPVKNFGAPGKVRITIGTHEANKTYIQALQNIIV